MKIPQAKQLPSGSWYIRIRVDGEDVSITRNTEAEAIAEAMSIKAGLKEVTKRAPKEMTLREAIDKYINLREATLSPATVRGYVIIRDNRFQSVMDRTINRTTDQMYQKAVDKEVGRLASKTLHNSWSFVATVLRTIAKREVTISVPTPFSKEHLFLQPSEIKVFVPAIEGHRHELAMLLALHGLRASEILDVTWRDIDLSKNIIRVRGSAVPDKNNKMVHKATNKNTSSRRDVPFLLERLRQVVQEADKSNKYVFTLTESALYGAINRVCKNNDLPLIGTHGLRHSMVSLCFHLRLPEETIMLWGGYSDYVTMKKIYTHLAEQDLVTHTTKVQQFFTFSNDDKNDDENKKAL